MQQRQYSDVAQYGNLLVDFSLTTRQGSPDWEFNLHRQGRGDSRVAIATLSLDGPFVQRKFSNLRRWLKRHDALALYKAVRDKALKINRLSKGARKHWYWRRAHA